MPRVKGVINSGEEQLLGGELVVGLLADEPLEPSGRCVIRSARNFS